MPESLYRLAYYSKNAIDRPGQELANEIRQILAAARRNNPPLGVTGALMFNRGCFAQVLEGPRENVAETFERIQRDPRHAEVMLIGFDPIETRGFADWSMAFVGASSTDHALYGDIGGESGFDPFHLTGNDLFNVLHDLVVEEEDQVRIEA